MTGRRDAIKQLAAAVAVGSVTSLRELMAEVNAVPRPGVQLYTVRSEMKKSVEATLARVAKIGYREVEFAGYFDCTPAQISAALKASGLVAPSAHIGLADMRGKWEQTLDAAAKIGHQYVVLAYLTEEERGDAEKYRRLAEEMNVAARAAKAHGLKFAYHNHDFEFAPLAGTHGYDVLLAECDPALVQFEMDLFWVTKAGKDPLDLFAAHPGRFPLVHVKDMKRDGSMTDVGSGVIPFARIFARARQAGIRHYYAEFDNPTDPFASIATSYKALRKL
ncbi:MAG: sugar phosphate isomerase/epimerase family protein [Gemmatimonadaceae bacterium]